MKIAGVTGTILLLTTTTAGAVGLDRSNQDITAIFETGNYVELSYGMIMPSLSGADLAGFGGAAYDSVGDDFSQMGGSIKYQVNPRMSVALIFDQPFGVDVLYPGSPATTALGGTEARLDSAAITAIGRFALNDNFSIHAGVRGQQLSGDITLSGAGYGDLNGYNVELQNSTGYGYVVGAAFERPDIALRLAVTYQSAITHDFNSVETLGGVAISALPPAATGGLDGIGVTTVEAPQAVNINFQTGIMADTLLFGQIRYAQYADTIVSPEFFAEATSGGSLTDIDSGTSYSLGIGRRFTDAFSGSISVGYEAEGDPLVSPLSPTNGNTSVSVGGQYTFDNVVLSGGLRYTVFGNAQPETAVAVADFTDNSALSAGFSIGFRF